MIDVLIDGRRLWDVMFSGRESAKKNFSPENYFDYVITSSPAVTRATFDATNSRD
jgi:hypothetical protein